MRRLVRLAGLALGVAWSVAAWAQPAPPALVLDQSAYCRQYVQFGIDRIDGPLLRSEGTRWLGPRLDVLKRSVRQRWSYLGKAWDEQAWMDDAMIFFAGLQYGDRSRADTWASTPRPPEGWEASDFDDAAWLRQKSPLMVGSGGWHPGVTLGRQRGCFRYHFNVPDPDKAGDLELDVVYRGGVRVLVNGQEIGRGHLETGPLPPAATAPAYEAAAYSHLTPEGGPVLRTDKRAAGRPVFVGNMGLEWDRLPPVQRDPKSSPPAEELRLSVPGKGMALTRAQWEAFSKLRNRRLEKLVVPRRLLRKGDNVLAVDVRTSNLHPLAALWTDFVLDANESWDHCLLVSLSLRDPSGSIPPATARPGGVQVWAEDMHRRLCSAEYGATAAPGVVRFVGAANGTFSAQVVVASDRPLAGLKAVAGELKADGGPALPASAIEVRPLRARPLTDLVTTGQGRGGPSYMQNPLTPWAVAAIDRFGGLHRQAQPAEQPTTMVEDVGRAKANPNDQRLKLAAGMSFFDHIGPPGAVDVPANSCQPLWLSLRVPEAQPPGLYKGTLTVSAEGMPPRTLPIEAEVAGWRVPDPRDLQTLVCLEQGAYGVAAEYKLEPWSPEHIARMEDSFRQLARVGNDWLFVPVIGRTELGNMNDSPIRWTRGKDGQFRFDFSRLDRYLDLAVKHLGPVRVICFIVSIGAAGNPAEVQVLDEASGLTQTLSLADSTSPVYQSAWRALGYELHQHMRGFPNRPYGQLGSPGRGLAASMHWGYGWDDLGDRDLPLLLAQVAPDVPWAAGGHRPPQGHYFKANSRIYGISLTESSQQGWRDPDVHVYNPRGGGSLIALDGHALPIGFRLLPDRCICVGLNGLGRMGADYWANVYLQGLREEGFLRPGMPISHLLWPGRDGAESSARFEALVEGVQEADARIFLEQALVAKALPDELATKAAAVLSGHHRETLYVPSLSCDIQILETVSGWQDRSRRLFGVAAEAAQAVELDMERSKLSVTLPARGSIALPLKARCWSAGQRRLKLSASAAWIKIEKPEFVLTGHAPLPVTLDAAALEPGAEAKGTLTVALAGGGRSWDVEIDARVSKVFDYVPADRMISRQEYRFIPDEGKMVLTLAPGQQAAGEVTFVNRAGAAVEWAASAGEPWVTVEPASGQAQPGAKVTLTATARPSGAGVPNRPYGRLGSPALTAHDVTLTVSERGGSARQEIPVRVYVVPPSIPTSQAASAPAGGEAVLLTSELHQKMLKSRRQMQPSWCAHEVIHVGPPAAGTVVRGVAVKTLLSNTTPCEMVYRLEGAGFESFSASVGLAEKGGYWTGYGHTPPDWVRVRFEVYVDGQLRAASSYLSRLDPPHRLQAGGLGGAKELRLVTRFEKVPPYSVSGIWYNPQFTKP